MINVLYGLIYSWSIEIDREKHGAWRQLRPNVPCLEIHNVHKEPLQEGRGAAA